MQNLLLIEDDVRLAQMVADYLRSSGFAVAHCGDAASGLAHIRREEVDLLVLDLMLPDSDGLSVCRQVRAMAGAAAKLPIVMLTAKGDPMDRIIGLEMGADDYLPKPFEPRELVARLRAVLRRAKGTSPRRALQFEGWRLDREQHVLLNPQDEVVMLSTAEFRLLCAFVDHPRRVLSRERLLQLTRAEGTEVNDRAIDLAVSRLRAKLGDSARGPQLLRTVRGEGYSLDCEVSPCSL